ncbi:hypothetical protein RS130_16525 [Paraglaciecola aquimarina]|uniref:DUF4405 domain-containing protein n=1 Tax=Paraglaciecola aquimarina TaxID=1235557 RepID=A0ABU3SZ71_9ALTE|nr:hypothetical protein [Paraglaciecola aquimarina]MDU0355296.1 hypothetical protein [Paraglaciecola aquimarina]
MLNKHFMHFALLMSFVTLTITGVVAYTLPFSLINTRLHILFATSTLFFVLYHLLHKYGYFLKTLTRSSLISKRLLVLLSCMWMALIVAGWNNLMPVNQLVDFSYEARHQKEILRSSEYTATELLDDSLRTVRIMQTDKTDIASETSPTTKALHTALNIEVRLPNLTKLKPAIAIWAESTTGALIETLYLSPELAYSDNPSWHGHAVKRNQVLPVWRSKYTLVSGLDPNGNIDASTGATDTHSFSLNKYFQLDEREYVIYFEVNFAFDPNEEWPDKFLGQPSVLYSAFMEHGEQKQYAILELTGHGGTMEKGKTSGEIHYDLDSITTAKQQVDLVLVAGSKGQIPL